MRCIVNSHFKVLYGHFKLLSVCSRFFGLLDTFEVLASGMPVLPAIQATPLCGTATVSQILQASCPGIASVFVHADLLKLKCLVLCVECWKKVFGNIFSNISTECLCTRQLINGQFWEVGIVITSVSFCIYLHHPSRLANYLKNDEDFWGVSKGNELFVLFIWERTF